MTGLLSPYLTPFFILIVLPVIVLPKFLFVFNRPARNRSA